MAVTILYTITRSDDFKQIEVQDANTQWTIGGDMDKSNVTAVNLEIFGIDPDTPLKTVTFTSDERTAFLAGTAVPLLFSDSRLWATTYAPDDFYIGQLNVLGGTVIATQVAFDSHFYMKKIIMESVTSVAVPIEGFYNANKAITGNLAAITSLDYLSSSISISRENKWRKIYSFLSNNYNL